MLSTHYTIYDLEFIKIEIANSSNFWDIKVINMLTIMAIPRIG